MSARFQRKSSMLHLFQAQVLSRGLGEAFRPPLPVLTLRWDADAPGVADRAWHLPEQLRIDGPAPERFGCAVERLGHDAYHVKVLWNRMCLSWPTLTRRQILTCSLPMILQAVGIDIGQLLDQPISRIPLSTAA
jgi:hypothetical protein